MYYNYFSQGHSNCAATDITQTNGVYCPIESIILLIYLKVAEQWPATHASPLLVTGLSCHCVSDNFNGDSHGHWHGSFQGCNDAIFSNQAVVTVPLQVHICMCGLPIHCSDKEHVYRFIEWI